MKKAILVLAYCLLATFTTKAQDVKDIQQIVFLTTTRGYLKQVTITPKVVEVKQEDSKEGIDSVNFSRRITRNEWKKVSQSLKNVSLPEIPTLESPTMNRTFDGARNSSITLTLKNGKTFSHSFDNENPHQLLNPLMEVIVKIGVGK